MNKDENIVAKVEIVRYGRNNLDKMLLKFPVIKAFFKTFTYVQTQLQQTTFEDIVTKGVSSPFVTMTRTNSISIRWFKQKEIFTRFP